MESRGGIRLVGSGLIVKDYLDALGFTKARTLQSENQILHTYGVQNKILNPEQPSRSPISLMNRKPTAFTGGP